MAPNAKAEEKIVDLLDIYNQNQSDLNNGIFNDLSANIGQLAMLESQYQLVFYQILIVTTIFVLFSVFLKQIAYGVKICIGVKCLSMIMG